MTRYLIAVALCAAAPSLAAAHAALDGEAVPGRAAELSVRIGHGCDGAPVTAVEVELPDGFAGIRPMAKPGWDIAVTGRTIRWSGGALDDAHYDRFAFRARASAEVAHETPVPVRQFCGDVEVAWIEIAAAGQDPHDLPFPAPLLKVAGAAVAGPDHGHAHGQAHGSAEGAAMLGDLSVADAFARAPAAPGGASAAYMTIRTAGAADRLLAASSPDAARVELHTHTVDEAGVARMREVEAIDVAPDAPAELKPGGLHVMLMGPRADLEAGQTIALTLQFETAGEVTVAVPVVAAGRGQAAGHDHSQEHNHDHGHDHGHGEGHGHGD